MSRTTLFAVPVSGPVKRVFEYANSWLGAVYIWRALATRHLTCAGEDPRVSIGRVLLEDAAARSLWGLASDPVVATRDRLVLASTFDYCICEFARLRDLADLFDAFAMEYGGATNLPDQAADLRRLATDPEGSLAGVCWQQTSVAENLWWVATPTEDDADDGRPYDVARDDKHWFLFEQYEAPPCTNALTSSPT